MLVVPIHKDVIKTKDGSYYRVVSYTNFKEAGPAVYGRATGMGKTNVLVYFIDIEEINGTRVEYQKGSRVFNALGKMVRPVPLPQPDDKIVIMTDDVTDEDGKETAKVESLKLKSKALGIAKGMFVRDTDGKLHRLKNIINIEPSLGSNTFKRAAFLETYKDYTGA